MNWFFVAGSIGATKAGNPDGTGEKEENPDGAAAESATGWRHCAKSKDDAISFVISLLLSRLKQFGRIRITG